jgi:hypothetical protein
MEKNAKIVVFDEFKNKDTIDKEDIDIDSENEDKEKPPSYYLFDEILTQRSFVPIIDSDYDKPDHVIMVVPLNMIEDIEEIIPSYWEAYVYWQYSSTKISINNLGLSKIVNRMFYWLMRLKKMPYVIITGFKDDEDRIGLSRINIMSCLAYNGLPDDRLFFIDDGRCQRDILVIEDLVKSIETSL